ncbi:MAG TPA: DUF1549 domain-containing protein, partial [Verrucomicrobiota bacterium]|nr:DUF1549 domain-containing protein [Verrucomicrobiota bacterium]
MNRPFLRRWPVPAVLASAVSFLAGAAPVLPPPAGREVDFAREVAPLFERHCVSCHGPERQRGGFRLDQRAAALAGGDGGPAIHPGRSADSPLIQFVAGYPEDMRMPAKGDPLTPAEIGVLRAWIDQGAPWDGDAAKDDGPASAHWAFQPVRRPPVPSGEGTRLAATGFGAEAAAITNLKLEIGNPIDAFVREALAAQGLTPSPEANRRTLIRRLHLVMLGLPPTPEEVAAFEADDAPGAFARLVDAVLADPRYGERWGRHWLDVVRFAESHGFETNRERLHAWRFRDYVIAAFNDDRPYALFVREQLAGDAFGADAATGFLVAGPVDIVKSPDPALTAQQRADELDDMVATTGTTFLGLTLGCARCHTHKFDPVTHREYHAVAALFAGVQHGDRALPPPPGREGELAAADERLRGLEAKLARFLPPGGTLRPPVNAAVNEEDF